MSESIENLTDKVITLNDGESPMSLRQAANALAQHRYKDDAAAAAAPPEAAAPTTEDPPQGVDVAPPQEATGEDATATIDPAAEQPLDLPRSWAKDRAESWAKLDRDTQQYLLEHDSKASTEVRRTQNESAEQRKALDAERQQLEQVRTQYEQALPLFLQSLQEQQQGQFADIKTMTDVERMAREDWPRYALWDAHQKKVAAVNAEMQASQQRQQQEYQSQWSKFAQEQDAKFAESVPEAKDPAKLTKLANSGRELLNDLGFTQSELDKLWSGENSVSLRDARIQRLVVDAIRYREAKAAVPKAAAKTVPHVQRPGSPALHARDTDTAIAARDKAFNNKPDWRNAAELLIARRAANK
jgi:hypothetical protein